MVRRTPASVEGWSLAESSRPQGGGWPRQVAMSTTNTPDTTGVGGNCDTLPQCVLIFATYGLPTTGGITEKLLKPSFLYEGDDAESYWRLTYDLLFFVVFNVLLLNLVFGVILDTFATLRQERQAVSTFLNTRCFVCGRDHVATCDMHHHVKSAHNTWA
uniref:Ion transport domain-containing protein n=1 Tax=Neobodo designis TaxID=312471 RepID=A0A7S1R1M0_NEODS|mmetsp:Transcript_6824/g.21401  ORF Transcript_6824/g.21401 Transcript_6824/m.21401 type:complete len:159 (+) Transcript_6824:428-904(+)